LSVAIVLKNVDPLYIRYSDGMEVLGKRLTKGLYEVVNEHKKQRNATAVSR